MGYAEPYLDEGYLESVSCSSASFCMAVGEHAFGGSAEKALIFNGSTWSTPSEIPIRPEHVQSYVGSVRAYQRPSVPRHRGLEEVRGYMKTVRGSPGKILR